MTLDEIRKVKEKYADHLMSLKNVVSVGIGRKEVQGAKTGEPAIIIGVVKKLPKELLKASDVIPPTLNGIKTDVIQVGEIRAL